MIEQEMDNPLFQWGPPLELCAHFQFDSRFNAASSNIGSVLIVSLETFPRLVLNVLYHFKDVLMEPNILGNYLLGWAVSGSESWIEAY